MMPVVFKIPWLGWDIPGYGLMLTVGFLLSVVWAARRAQRSGANPDVVLNCAFLALVFGIAGARAMYVTHYWDHFNIYPSAAATFWAVIDVRRGGLEVYGGVIASMIVVLVYLLIYRHSLRWYFDIMAPSVALGMGIGRIGCFLNGCCWGTECDLPWAVRFPFGSNTVIQQWYDGEPALQVPPPLMYFPEAGITSDGRAAGLLPRELIWINPARMEALREQTAILERLQNAKTEEEKRQAQRDAIKLGCGCSSNEVFAAASIRSATERTGMSLAELQALARQTPSRPVHPTQLYSAGLLISLALLLSTVYWRRTRDGQVICIFLLIEPWSRYLLELLRADNPVDTLGFTVSQFLALCLSLTGLIGLFLLRRLPPRSPHAKIWEPPPEPPKKSKRVKTA